MPPPGSVPPAKKARAAETKAPAVGLLGGYGDSDGDSGDDGDAAAPGSNPGAAASAKSGLPAGFFDEAPQDSEPAPAPVEGAGASEKAAVPGLPADFLDDDAPGDVQELTEETMRCAAAAAKFSYNQRKKAEAERKCSACTGHVKAGAGNTADSADKKATPGDSDENESGQSKAARAAKVAQAKAAVVPEGFFDDPKMDAKVRKVELVDKAQVEWDKFEKEIAAEDKVSSFTKH